MNHEQERRRERDRRRYRRVNRERDESSGSDDESVQANSDYGDSSNDSPAQGSSPPSSPRSYHSDPGNVEIPIPHNQEVRGLINAAAADVGGVGDAAQRADYQQPEVNIQNDPVDELMVGNDDEHHLEVNPNEEPGGILHMAARVDGNELDEFGLIGNNENVELGNDGININQNVGENLNQGNRDQPDMENSGEEDSDASSVGGGAIESEYDEESDVHSNASDSEEEQEDLNGFDENDPIYNGAGITVKESLLAILSFFMVHRLTGLCVNDLLSLIALHCGPNSPCLKSLYKFKTYFQMIGSKYVTRHFYCSGCEVPLANKDSICEYCEGRHSVSFFIELPIVTQLQSMFRRPGFYESLRFRFNRVKKNPANIEDIYDSNIYKENVASGFLSNPNNISFFMYFDGVSLFKSSSFSIWPVYLTINELSYKLRTRKENTVLVGIWFGKKKPNPNLFLRPLHEKLLSLKTDGAVMSLSDNRNILVRAILLGAVADMPAKSLFMRFKQYNGLFSCFNCMASGGRFDLGNNTIQIFPYSRNLELRNNDDMEGFAEQAAMAREVDPDASVYGVRGYSLLSAMLPNLILCMAQDIMHGVYLNAQNTLISLWFDTKYSANPFSISDCVNFVDLRLKSIKPPSTFQNLPRSIKKDLGHYKAFDYKMFMTYYSLPVLQGILPDIYWFHHCKLVSAISMLCQESISVNQIEIAENLLHDYVSDFQQLYGVRFLTLTFHQLLHLGQVVRNLGPTWVYSCFFYESLNGQLARLVHGSRHAALQISSACSAYMNLHVKVTSMNEGPAKALCLKFQGGKKARLKIAENIDNHTDVVGKFTNCDPVPNLIGQLLQDQFNIVGGRCKYFHRLSIKSTVFCSELYDRSKQKCSCYALIVHEDVPFLCKIASFIRWSPCVNCPAACAACPKTYVVIAKLYERVAWEIHDALHPVAHYLHRVNQSGTTRAFLINDIKSLCLYMNIDGKEYLCEPLNTLEVE